jgi:hypothetical protein
VDNIASIAEAGVDMFVAGSAILKAPRTQEAYKEVSNSFKLKPKTHPEPSNHPFPTLLNLNPKP